ncbi:MAG: hypothetical protein ACKO34_03305 [Vampirovibrionales bacterium]
MTTLNFSGWNLGQLPYALVLVASGRVAQPAEPKALASSTDKLVNPQGDFYISQTTLHALEEVNRVPLPSLSPTQARTLLKQPTQALRTAKQLASNPLQAPNVSEPLSQRLAMWQTLTQHLGNDTEALDNLNALLQSGRLTFNESPALPLASEGMPKHSTLYYLYAMTQTPRLPGFSTQAILKDTLAILAHPADIEQNNAPLDDAHRTLLANISNSGVRNKHHATLDPHPRTPNEFNVEVTYNCAMASLMSRMANLHPSLLASQLNQLTSRQGSMTVHTTAALIAPEDPSSAALLLKGGNLRFSQQGQQFTIELPAPAAGIIRADNTFKQQAKGTLNDPRTATPLESLYQSTLLYNAANKAYDVATDKRDTLDYASHALSMAESLTNPQKQELLTLISGVPQLDRLRRLLRHQLESYPNLDPNEKQLILTHVFGENSGLVDTQTTLMERILAVNHSYTTFPLQITGNKPNARPEEATKIFLMGYTRSFETIEQELINALDKGGDVLVSQANMGEDGEVVSAHVVKLDGYERDPHTHELVFLVTNTQDNQKGQRKELAREWIPTLNTVTFPHEQANKLWLEQMARPFVRLLPDETDKQHYRVPTVRDDVEPTPDSNPALNKLRSLYGTGQAPVLWQSLIQPWLEEASQVNEVLPALTTT